MCQAQSQQRQRQVSNCDRCSILHLFRHVSPVKFKNDVNMFLSPSTHATNILVRPTSTQIYVAMQRRKVLVMETCPHSELYCVRCLFLQGTWDAGSAGGGMGRAGYYTNPQYALVLTHPKTKVHVELKAPRDVSYGRPTTDLHP